MSRVVGLTMLPQQVAAGLIGLFGVVGLLLAATGLYGVIAHDVARRTRELGIRAALGARAEDLMRLVVWRAAGIAIVGCITGLALAAGATRLVQSLLHGVHALDVLTYGASRRCS